MDVGRLGGHIMATISQLLEVIANEALGKNIRTAIHDAISQLDTNKEPKLTAGTTSQYYKGNKTWEDFATSVRTSVLTGLSTTTNVAITAADSILTALGKIQAQLNNKVNVVAGKGLSTNDYTTAEKSKLSDIASGANNYVHPSTHSADIIVETTSKRFVSNSQIAGWNNKADPIDSAVGIGNKTVTGVALVMKDENGYYMREDGLGNCMLCYSANGHFAFPLDAIAVAE